MILRIFRFISIFTILTSCSMFYNSDKFDRQVWLWNDDMTDTSNPREKMTKDLLENYLKPGIPRDSILLLLGEPYLERIENRLARGVEIPDSLSYHNLDGLSTEQRDKHNDNLNAWLDSNSQSDTLMYYPVGWSTIDPRFLIIKFKPDSTAYEFWIEQT